MTTTDDLEDSEFRHAVLETLEESPLVLAIGREWIRCFGADLSFLEPDGILVHPVQGLDEDCTIRLDAAEICKLDQRTQLVVPGYPTDWPDAEWANNMIREILQDRILEANLTASHWCGPPHNVH